MNRAPFKSWIPFGLGLSLLACQPKIGDECVTDIDCSQAGDRLCDTTQPSGYCTQVDCDPTSCPEKEAICIAFNDSVSSIGACNTQGQTSPYRRSFCMALCKDGSDCRPGYSCMDMTRDNPWNAEIIDSDPKRNTVCVLSMTFAEPDEGQSDQVCTGDIDSTSGGGAGGAGGASN
jgi:hypothetical protein